MVEQHLADTFELISDIVPDNIALAHHKTQVTWREFDSQAASLSRSFGELGLQKGETVALAMYNCPEWMIAFYAIIKSRLVPANINYRYRASEWLHLLRDSRSKTVIFHSSLADVVQEIHTDLPEVRHWIMVDHDDGSTPTKCAIANSHVYENLVSNSPPAHRMTRPNGEHYLSYTGGTTGLPKGVLYDLSRTTTITSRFVDPIFDMQFKSSIDCVDITRNLAEEGKQVISLVAPPLMHSTGLAMTAIPTLAAGGMVITMKTSRFDPHLTLSEIENKGANRLSIVGDAFARPLVTAFEQARQNGKPFDSNSLRLITSSGAAWSTATKTALLEFLPQAVLMESCGATEGVSYGLRISKCGDSIASASFQPTPGLLVVDENHQPLPRQKGNTGLLASPTLAMGYFNAPDKTAQNYTTYGDKLYAVPGDYGRIEEDGSLTLLGRGSTVINTGGEKVHPEEVENVIKEIPGALDCLILGLPDDRFGQSVTALVQTTDPAAVSCSDVVSYVKQKLAGYKSPRQVYFTDFIPRLDNGKPDYKKAKELATKLASAAEG